MTNWLKENGTKWATDDRGNKCSVRYFGNEEKAEKALNSLINCDNCINCSGCSRCSDCSDCSGCSGCSHVAFVYDKKDLCGDPEKSTTGVIGQPPIPKIENIHTKIFEAVTQPQALNMDDWHTCNTTHCRGGWVVHLAGEAGYALERYHNTLLAAQLIYRESGYLINPCRFFDGNAAALADMKKLAETEAVLP